jgi:hypothetical protein
MSSDLYFLNSVPSDSLSEAAGTVRLQRLKMANAAIKRNAMDAVFPYIGDEAYGNCTAIVAALAPVTGSDAGEPMLSCWLLLFAATKPPPQLGDARPRSRLTINPWLAHCRRGRTGQPLHRRGRLPDLGCHRFGGPGDPDCRVPDPDLRRRRRQPRRLRRACHRHG